MLPQHEIMEAAKESGLYMTSPERIAAVERLVAIIERKTIEKCAASSWFHYMETCKKNGHGPDVERIRDFCSAAAIRKLGE